MSKLQHWKNILNKLRYFLAKGSINEHLSEYLKNNLHKEITFLSIPIIHTGFDQVYRVTINRNLPNNNNEKINEIKYLKYPPANSVKRNGRANYVGQSVLYATFDTITALSEMKPQIGDLITVSTWILPPEKNLVIAPVFMITSGNSGKSHNKISLDFLSEYDKALQEHPIEIQELIEEFIMFSAECFAKEIEVGNHFDYTLSAWLANKIFYEYEGGVVEAIVYPSVQQKLGMSNIVIKPDLFDKKYILHEVKESVVVMEPGINGKGYFLEGTNDTKRFDFESGKLIWEKKDTIFEY